MWANSSSVWVHERVSLQKFWLQFPESFNREYVVRNRIMIRESMWNPSNSFSIIFGLPRKIFSGTDGTFSKYLLS